MKVTRGGLTEQGINFPFQLQCLWLNNCKKTFFSDDAWFEQVTNVTQFFFVLIHRISLFFSLSLCHKPFA